jgi:predicted O-methyltransferase YrrM
VFIEPYTMVAPDGLAALERSVRSVIRRGIPGQLVECGTARGGSAALLALWLQRLKSPKKIYIFDTFEGLPEPTPEDPDYSLAAAFTGTCRGELQEVQDLFRRLGVIDRAVFVKGRFQDVLPTYDTPPIALLHLDGDWYESTMTFLQHLWDLVSPGGVVHIDDYGAWQGCQKAVDEFFASRGIHPKLHAVGSPRWLVKPAG